MKKRTYLMKIRRSRKKYLLFYGMVFAILFLLVYLIFKNYLLNKLTLITAFAFILLVYSFTELHRIKDWWAITDSSLVQSLGIFSKNVREIDFSSISDLDLDQSLFKRILNYGNVNVRLFLNETSIKINDVNKPGEFIEKLQKIISKNRRERSGGIR
jgi:uncharacterized membrane protein YdbT with pleckstrin-like domain